MEGMREGRGYEGEWDWLPSLVSPLASGYKSRPYQCHELSWVSTSVSLGPAICICACLGVCRLASLSQNIKGCRI